MLAVVAFLTFGLCSCSDDDDSRAFDKAQIVGVKVDGELFCRPPVAMPPKRA